MKKTAEITRNYLYVENKNANRKLYVRSKKRLFMFNGKLYKKMNGVTVTKRKLIS